MKSPLLCSIALGLLVGCSSSGGAPGQSAGDAAVPSDGAPGADSGIISCENDPRVMQYTASLSKTSPSGALTVTIVSADPAPPATQSNTWVVRLTDNANHAIVNAAVTVSAFMPDHGHGSSVRAVVTPQSDGTYEIKPIYLFMGGVWRITIGLASDGGASPNDEVQFFFCVEG